MQRRVALSAADTFLDCASSKDTFSWQSEGTCVHAYRPGICIVCGTGTRRDLRCLTQQRTPYHSGTTLVQRHCHLSAICCCESCNVVINTAVL